jgi:putative methyltransferase (TIGR01177 family)
MIVAYVEPSGESPALAHAEAIAAAEALGGVSGEGRGPRLRGLVEVGLPAPPDVSRLAARLALARRCLVSAGPEGPLAASPAEEGRSGRPAAFRRIGRSVGGSDPLVRAAGQAYRDAGGTIDLERPERTYWLADSDAGEPALLVEVAAIDRRATAARSIPHLPFRRPVALAPRLSRAAANLARVRPGEPVLDPFVGTGALLGEVALLGGRAYGIDRDAAMLRGALRNFAHLGVAAEALLEGDARTVDLRVPGAGFASIVTDPPYGRSSGTGGENAREVAREAVARWAPHVVPGGRLVVVRPDPDPVIDPPWTTVVSVSVRVHRSLTRTFSVYEKAGR